MPHEQRDVRRSLVILVTGLLVWGAFLAAGAFLGPRVSESRPAHHNLWRAVVVAVCVGGFLAFWGAMLMWRRRRLARRDLAPQDASGGAAPNAAVADTRGDSASVTET